MAKNWSVTDIKSWKFERIMMPEEWQQHLGNLTENFRMLIQGPSGHGKTEYVMKLSKMLAQHYGKVNFNSAEQGRSSTLQEAIIRNNMEEVTGKWMLAPHDCREFEKYYKKVSRANSGKVLIIDSLDYMKLTVEQFKILHERFQGRKSIIIVCWDDPMDMNAKKIKYMCDIKVKVQDFKAQIRSRFGGNKDYTIWDRKAGNKQMGLFERNQA